jgi:hypothetical protein
MSNGNLQQLVDGIRQGNAGTVRSQIQTYAGQIAQIQEATRAAGSSISIEAEHSAEIDLASGAWTIKTQGSWSLVAYLGGFVGSAGVPEVNAAVLDPGQSNLTSQGLFGFGNAAATYPGESFNAVILAIAEQNGKLQLFGATAPLELPRS